ncbi:MAG: prepilin-type N-terminal cleavage/methylation domain-containing protein [Bryobacteraceae bacterium]|nr:prepilin-type N-terminal cleavage/methylation domain-containing protein [Bryobacteraceae bacterium]
MERPMPSGKLARLRAGFTIVELMIVVTVISILLSMAVPYYQRTLVRSKESLLRNNLFTMRQVIDEFTIDKGKAPQSLQDLVTEGYLRSVPVDPLTGQNNTWKIIMEDAQNAVNQSEPGIFEVQSGSDKTSLEGTPYSDF